MSNDRFKSKSGFILASIGAAVGLGNALRFPGLCANYGGGAFLLIYFIALVVLGLPVLCAEIALGRKLKSGAPACLSFLAGEKRAKIGRAAGWSACLNSVCTAVIYAGLAGWILCTAVNIFPLCQKSSGMTQTQISQYFFSEILRARQDGVIDGFSFPVAGCIVAAWVLMYFCLRGGASSLAKTAKFTVIIPVVLLTCMACKGFFYPNAQEALSALFIPDFSALSSPELWITALGQVFFSLSVVVGIMPVYGSYLPEKSNIFTGALCVAAADFFVSVLASVVLFTTMYGEGLQSQISDSGIITAFCVYPAAITTLFGNNRILNGVAGVLFYVSLAMMAVQSAVSMIEAFISPFSAENNKNKRRTALIICLIGGAVSLIFATSGARIIAEIADSIVNFYNVLALGIAESLLFAFNKNIPDIAFQVNKFAPHIKKLQIKMPGRFFGISLRFLCPAVLILLCLFKVAGVAAGGINYPYWLFVPFGLGISVLISGLSTYFTVRVKKVK